MANLGQLTTDKRLSFVKYVADNKRFNEIEYAVEEKIVASLFKKSGTGVTEIGKPYPSGTKLTITSNKLVEHAGMKFAEVSIKGAKGLMQISKIRKPTGGNGTQYEDEVVDYINAFILNVGHPIDIKLKNKTFTNILYALKVDKAIKQSGGVNGDPKADIILCEDKSKPLAKSSVYLSHKKEGGPEAYQQYGGITDKAGKMINEHKIVQKFLGKVAETIGTGNQLPSPVMMNFDDAELSCMSIFGPDYGSAFSLQHVHAIVQGKPVFKFIKEGVYELKFSSGESMSGDLSHFKDGYLPVLGATYRAGRGFDYKGKRYNGARCAIYPAKLMKTRSGLITFN